jgi:hypothetical protein
MNGARIDRHQAKRRASKGKDVNGVSRSFARFRVDSTPYRSSICFPRAQRALEMPKGGESS